LVLSYNCFIFTLESKHKAMSRKVTISVPVELTFIMDDDANVDDVLSTLHIHSDANDADLYDENIGDYTIIDSK
jgi:hypothetical protein